MKRIKHDYPRPLPKHMARIWASLKDCDRLCCEQDPTEEGRENGGLRWWIEPGARPASPKASLQLCKLGFLIPVGDSLFGLETSQTYRKPLPESA